VQSVVIGEEALKVDPPLLLTSKEDGMETLFWMKYSFQEV
jgi:hypothetical protein